MPEGKSPLNIAIRVVWRTCTITAWIAIAVICVVVLLVAANVVARYIFRQPIVGTVELVEMLAIILVFFVLGYTEIKGGHVSVTILVSRLPRRAQAIITGIMSLFSTVLAAFVFWQGLKMGLKDLYPIPVTSVTLLIPTSPFLFCLAFGSLLFALTLLMHALRYLTSGNLSEYIEGRNH